MTDFNHQPRFSSVRDSRYPTRVTSIYSETASDSDSSELASAWSGMPLREMVIGIAISITVGVIGASVIVALIK